MAQRSEIWRFSGVLRGVALLMAGIYAFSAIFIWVTALFGTTENIFGLINIDSMSPLKPWQLLLGIAFTSVFFSGYIVICLAANQFLKTAKRAGFFIEEVITACRKLACGLMIHWVGTVLIKNIMPWVMTYHFPEKERMAIVWGPFTQFEVLLVGVILLLMAKAMEEARVIDSDNKQFI